MSADGSQRAPGTGGDDLFAVAVIAMGLASFAVWVGAQLASLTGSGRFLAASPADGLGALIRLPANGRDPAAAWPSGAGSTLPGPILYWTATTVTLVVLVGAGVWLWLRLAPTIGTRQRRRLGVTVGARLATSRDLAPLVVPGPTGGRFIFGAVGRRLLATETRRPADSARRHRNERPGGRSALAVIGPSQSGKTATVVAGILDWDGPAILSSVKNDLFADTVARRLQLGKVYLFDPMRTIPKPPPDVIRVGWSPLPVARTVPGAIEVAGAMLDAAPTDGVTNASYWTSKGEALLWPILFAAAHGNDTSMADVVRWLASQDGNLDATDGDLDAVMLSEIRTILSTRSQHHDRRIALQSRHALAQFDGFFHLDHRTRSDIYSTSQTLVQPWEDPNVSYASTRHAGPTADMGLVLSGANTLYVCTPLKDASRYAVVFGGLLGSLLRDQAYDIANRLDGPLPDLLCVIDEAGNTPLRWLPAVASTCSGIGVQLVTAWQSKAQIDAIYQSQAGPMLTNHATKLIFAGVSDVETLQYVTYLGGDEEVAQRSANADASAGGHRRGVGDSTVHRPLLPAEVLRQARPGHALLIHGTLPPAHVQGRHAGSDKRLARLAAGDAPVPEPVAPAEELVEALNADPTPPLEVLEHLRPSRPPAADQRRTASQDRDDRRSQPQPLRQERRTSPELGR